MPSRTSRCSGAVCQMCQSALSVPCANTSRRPSALWATRFMRPGSTMPNGLSEVTVTAWVAAFRSAYAVLFPVSVL